MFWLRTMPEERERRKYHLLDQDPGPYTTNHKECSLGCVAAPQGSIMRQLQHFGILKWPFVLCVLPPRPTIATSVIPVLACDVCRKALIPASHGNGRENSVYLISPAFLHQL